MASFLFDCETNGLLDQLTKIHSLVLEDIDTGFVRSFADHPGFRPISEGVRLLQEADLIVGHNIVKFDIPAIKKVYPDFYPRGKNLDTLICSRVIWTNLATTDKRLAIIGQLPKKLTGAHALKAWGYRLGVLKGDFGETTDWDLWTPEMQSYCEQDVAVTRALYKQIKRKRYSEECIELEHEFAQIIALQEQNGFTFNEEVAAGLYSILVARRLALVTELQAAFPPEVIEETFIPKVNNKARGYVKGEPLTKILTV
eukprot:gene20737-21435_t